MLLKQRMGFIEGVEVPETHVGSLVCSLEQITQLASRCRPLVYLQGTR